MVRTEDLCQQNMVFERLPAAVLAAAISFVAMHEAGASATPLIAASNIRLTSSQMLALSAPSRLLSALPPPVQPSWRLLRLSSNRARHRACSVVAMAPVGAGGGTAAATAATHLVWFRPGDLRLADHEPLHTASSCLANRLTGADGQPPLLLPFCCLDERQLAAAERSQLGLPQLGPHRLRCAWAAAVCR